MAAGADGWTQAPCFCPGPPPGSPSRWQRCRGYSVLHSQAWHAAASVPCLYSSVVLWQVVFPKNDPSLPPTHTHTHTHTPFVLTLLTLCTRWGLGRGLCPPPAAECDGLRAVTGQARTGRDGASRDSSRLGSPSWEPLGCLEALSTWKSRVQASQSWAPPGGHASGSQPYGGSSRPPRRADPSPPMSQAVSRTGRALVLSHHGSG